MGVLKTHVLRTRVRMLTLGILALVPFGCTYQPFTCGFPGPYPVETYFDEFEFRGHPVEFTVYLPAGEPRPASCPVVIFGAGWNQPRTTNEALCEQLAQWGMVVVNRQYPSLLNSYFNAHLEHTSLALDWVIGENRRPASRLYGMIDETRAAAAGYSMGAGVAVGAASRDARFKACVAMDALGGELSANQIDGIQSLNAASLYIRSTVPGRFFSTANYYPWAPPPAMEVNVVGASHMQFEDRIVGLNQLGPILAFPDGPADDEVTRAIAARYTVAWLKVYLEGDAEFWMYLTGDAAQADVNANLVTIQSRLVEQSAPAD